MCKRRLAWLFLFCGLAACSDDAPTDAPDDDSGTDASDSGADEGGVDAVADVSSDVPAEPETLPLFDETVISSEGGAEHFQRARAEVDWGSGPFTSVTLRVELGTTCYPFESWSELEIPEGHVCPASCDAFDRNFEFTLDEPQQQDDPPAIELVRAITPFGGPLTFDVDITDIANGLPGAHSIDVMIATWSDGSGQITGSAGRWTVSASLELVAGPAPREVVGVVPLFNGSQGLSELLERSFDAPEGAVDVEVQYRVTGHGGAATDSEACIGPAEEFCQRTHEIYFDGDLIDTMVPWRDDCETLCTITRYGTAANGFDYCLENPTGLIQSVQAPRANWCPGSLTPPFTWQPTGLAQPGTHTFGFRIQNVLGGGSWRVSAHAIFYGP